MFPVSSPNFLPTFPTVLNRGSYNRWLNTSFPSGETVKQGLAIDFIGNNISSYARGGEWRSMGFLTSIATPNSTVVHSNRMGGAPVFNGVNSFYTGTVFEPRFFTISVWFRATGPPSVDNDGGGGGLVVANSQFSQTGFLLGYSWLNSAIAFGNDGSTSVIFAPNNSAPRNTVLHATIRLDGVTRDIYINGLLSASNAWTTAPPYPASGDRNYKIGWWGLSANPRPFNGEIYRVSMYDRALTPSEILQNYTAQRGLYGV
jgi:hypothetical protein